MKYKILAFSLFIIFKESISELLIDTCMPDGIEEDLEIIVGPEEEKAKLPSEASISSQDLAEAEQAFLPWSEHIAVSPLIEVDEPIEEEEPEQKEAEKSSEFGSSGEQPESETLASNEKTLVKETGVNIGYETGKCNDILTGLQWYAYRCRMIF